MWGGLLLGVLGGSIIGLVVGGNDVTDSYEIDLGNPEQVELLKTLTAESPPDSRK